jgi:DNA-binding NtrC family response regulator
MQNVYKMIGRLAMNDVPALVVGERGTGKEIVVATIHENSGRRDQPFLTLDCLTMPEPELEAELFGQHVGTLHLASVHALPKALQARVARALGEDRGRSAVRAAAHVALRPTRSGAAVEAGTFSRELYDALAVITLQMPPLRERLDDIPILVKHFILRFSDGLSRGVMAA